MTALDQQFMVKNESVYGTAVTPDRTFEINSEGIEDDFRRTEGDPLRVGTFFKRADRSTPYYGGAAGAVPLDVMTKGFAWWFKHMLGAVATTGPTETVVYTHTGTVADLFGTSFTGQVTRPFHPSGTVQPFTFEGGKVTQWELANAVDGNLMFTPTCDFQQVATATATATAGYPSGMENLTWAGGTVTLGGSQVDVSEFAMTVDNGLNVERRFISGTTDKKEPTGGRREGSWSIQADFATLNERNRAASTTTAGMDVAIVATWLGPTLLGTTIKPTLQVTIAAGQCDEWKAANEGPEGISQELSGSIKFDGTNSAVSIVYKSADSTA